MDESGQEGKTIEMLKVLLGIQNDEKEILLQFAYWNAIETVKNYCQVEEVPEGLDMTVLRMAADIYRNEQMGNAEIPQAVTSVSVGDTSTNFKESKESGYSQSLLKDYRKILNRYRRINFGA